MVTSRSVPQQTAQIFSPLAGQKRAALRFSQIGQNTESPKGKRTIQQNTLWQEKRQKGVAVRGKPSLRCHDLTGGNSPGEGLCCGWLRLRFWTAWRRRYSIWPLTLRNSSCDQASNS